MLQLFEQRRMVGGVDCLVGIEHKNPIPRGLLERDIARLFEIIFPWLVQHPCTQTCGDLDRAVGGPGVDQNDLGDDRLHALNRLGDPRYRTALSNYLRSRYVDDRFDLVIASGPAVVDFLNRDASLFQAVPLVFTTRPGLLGGPNSTGIVSDVDLTSTLSAALAAQPDTKHVYVVSGIAPFDRLYAEIFRTQRAPFASRVTFHDLAGFTLPDLEARVRTLLPKSIVFYLSVSDDGAGHTVLPLDAVEPISRAANAAVYSWHEDALGHGIVGGHLHSSVKDAQETARIALRVLNGEMPGTIPAVRFDSYTYRFDARQLQRWGISEARLPAGSFIAYRDTSFFSQYRGQMIPSVPGKTGQFGVGRAPIRLNFQGCRVILVGAAEVSKGLPGGASIIVGLVRLHHAQPQRLGNRRNRLAMAVELDQSGAPVQMGFGVAPVA